MVWLYGLTHPYKLPINCRLTVMRISHIWDGIVINRKLDIDLKNENVINDEWKKRDYSIDLTGFPHNRRCFTNNKWSISCYRWFWSTMRTKRAQRTQRFTLNEKKQIHF